MKQFPIFPGKYFIKIHQIISNSVHVPGPAMWVLPELLYLNKFKGDSRDPQWDPFMVSFLYYSHTTPIRIPKDMGIVWETYHKGVPSLGVPENILDKWNRHFCPHWRRDAATFPDDPYAPPPGSPSPWRFGGSWNHPRWNVRNQPLAVETRQPTEIHGKWYLFKRNEWNYNMFFFHKK